jgi:hypothetical protein
MTPHPKILRQAASSHPINVANYVPKIILITDNMEYGTVSYGNKVRLAI